MYVCESENLSDWFGRIRLRFLTTSMHYSSTISVSAIPGGGVFPARSADLTGTAPMTMTMPVSIPMNAFVMEQQQNLIQTRY